MVRLAAHQLHRAPYSEQLWNESQLKYSHKLSLTWPIVENFISFGSPVSSALFPGTTVSGARMVSVLSVVEMVGAGHVMRFLFLLPTGLPRLFFLQEK